MAGSQADFWQGPTGLLPVVNAAGNVFEEVQIVATPGQSLFTLLTFTYTPGTHSIFVWRNTPTGGGIGGELLRRNVSFTETASNQVTIVGGTNVGDAITFVAFAINQLTPPIVNNGLPSGGATGSVLQKLSASDFDANWIPQTAVTTLLDAVRQNIASASTVNLVAIQNISRNINITGNIQIDGFQITNGQVWVVKFAGVLTLKNNGNISTETGADIVTTANATCLLRAIADNLVEVVSYSGPTGDIVLGSINSGAIGGKRNLFYNGGMTNSQRGQSILAATGNATVCDGWISTVTATTVSTTILQLAASSAASGFALDFAVTTTTGATTVSMQQRIEAKNSKRLSGKTITVSGRVKHNHSVGIPIEVDFIKPTATDNYGGVVLIGGVAGPTIQPNVDTAFATTFTLGATDADLGLGVNIVLSSGALTAASLFFYDLQIEVGRVATPFEHQSAALADIESKRYLRCTNYGNPKGTGTTGTVAAVAVSTSILVVSMRYDPAMRAVPSVQMWENGIQNQIRDLTTGVPLAATIATLTSHNINGFALITTTAAVLTVGRGYDFDLIISSEM